MDRINDELMKAAIGGWIKEVRRCLNEATCNPLSKDEYGFSALMWAVWNGHDECVKLLLPHSDPLAQNMNGDSALMLAAAGGDEAFVRLLLPVSDPLAVSNSGRSAIQMAREGGHDDLAEMILAHMAQKEAGMIFDQISLGAKEALRAKRSKQRI